MKDQQELSMVTVSVPDTTTAEDLAEAIILRKLAAVVHLVPEVKTVRAYPNLLDSEIKFRPEVLMIIKTPSEKETVLADFLMMNAPAGAGLDIISVRINKASSVVSKLMKELVDE